MRKYSRSSITICFFIGIFFIIFFSCNRKPTKVLEERDPVVKKMEERDSINVHRIDKDSLQRVKEGKIKK